MAGIGFELRRHLRKESFTDLLRAYVAAGVIGSGPWIISICSMLLIGLLTQKLGIGGSEVVTPFLATVTHLMATSLIVSGLVQLVFTRFVADRLFEKKEGVVSPNVVGILLLTTVVSSVDASTRLPIVTFALLTRPLTGAVTRENSRLSVAFSRVPRAEMISASAVPLLAMAASSSFWLAAPVGSRR